MLRGGVDDAGRRDLGAVTIAPDPPARSEAMHRLGI